MLRRFHWSEAESGAQFALANEASIYVCRIRQSRGEIKSNLLQHSGYRKAPDDEVVQGRHHTLLCKRKCDNKNHNNKIYSEYIQHVEEYTRK